MLNPSSNLRLLMDAPVEPGRLAWIGLRAERRGPVIEVDAAQVSAAKGLVGDHYGGRAGGKRQVTLIAQEDITAAAGFLHRDDLSPALLRRNLMTAGINLIALKERWIAIGEAVLEITGECHPCSLMEAVLGTGGYNALRGRGGLTARVVRDGAIRVGDRITRMERGAIGAA